MGNGWGPLLPNLDHPIRYKEPVCPYRDREYGLSSAWSSAENWIEIDGIEPDDLRGDTLALPHEVAVKIAAAILYAEVSEVYDGIVETTEYQTHALAKENQEAHTRVLKHILRDELDPEIVVLRVSETSAVSRTFVSKKDAAKPF